VTDVLAHDHAYVWPHTGARSTHVVEIALKPWRWLGAAMVVLAAIRPFVPFEVAPPCPLRTLTGVPCPLCGMTRGVTAVVHGHLGRAAELNPGAFAAVGAALLLLVFARAKRVTIPVWTVGVAFAALWGYQLFKYATGRPL